MIASFPTKYQINADTALLNQGPDISTSPQGRGVYRTVLIALYWSRDPFYRVKPSLFQVYSHC